MFVAGLTGGIGAGKSTLAALLAERGAQVVDADALGHDAIRPGKRAWEKIVSLFGDEILQAGSMEIDRKRLGRIVFADSGKRAALNAIVHPEILRRIGDELDRLRATDEIVVLDAALIVELGLEDALDTLVVVTAPEPIRGDRLHVGRGMSGEDFKARTAAQSPPAAAKAKASIVVTNAGSLEDLAREADRVWEELVRMKEAAAR